MKMVNTESLTHKIETAVLQETTNMRGSFSIMDGNLQFFRVWFDEVYRDYLNYRESHEFLIDLRLRGNASLLALPQLCTNDLHTFEECAKVLSNEWNALITVPVLTVHTCE